MVLARERDTLAIRKQTAEEYKDPMKRKKFYDQEVQKAKTQLANLNQEEATLEKQNQSTNKGLNEAEKRHAEL
jgi:hypothetical protein